jgi:ERCC4-type nuclease
MPLGKRTEELRTRVDEETLEELNRRARAEGMGLSEWLALKLMIEVHGIESVTSLYVNRLNRIAGIGKESA